MKFNFSLKKKKCNKILSLIWPVLKLVHFTLQNTRKQEIRFLIEIRPSVLGSRPKDKNRQRVKWANTNTSDAQASAHSLKQTQSLVCFLLHLNVFNVLKPQCWNSQIQRRWKQITSSHRCTSAKYLTWYIAPRCYWDQRPPRSPVMNIQMRCSICVGEIIGKLQKRAGFSLKPRWNRVTHQPEWLAEIPRPKLKWDILPAPLEGGEKKNLKSACWHFKPRAKSNMSAEQVFLNSAQHDGALRNCLGLNFTKKKKRQALRWKLKKKNNFTFTCFKKSAKQLHAGTFQHNRDRTEMYSNAVTQS